MFMVELRSKLEIFEGALWGHHIRIPAEVAEKLVEGNKRRVVCHFSNSISINCALMPISGEYYILINKKIRSKLGLFLGQQLKVSIEKDTSEYGMPMPDELLEVLEQEGKAFYFFKKLTAGKQRTLIYIVSKVKNTNSRLNKAFAIAQHLNENEGIVNFKSLNELIKVHNNRYKI